MFFGKKNKNGKQCENCGSKTSDKHNFCPQCGNTFLDAKSEREMYGLLGRDDSIERIEEPTLQNFGITDKLINSMFNAVLRNLDKQMRDQFREFEKSDGRAEVKSYPNGIRIKISGPMEMKPRKKQKDTSFLNRSLDDSQVKKMNSLPREKAKSSVKRLGNKVLYELAMPGVVSPEDIFVSKLESGYEIKAIGSKKVYVNSLPINLPMRKYSISNNKLLVEFSAEE